MDPFESAARVRARLAELAASGARPMRFASTWGHQWAVVVSPDPSKPGRWRSTRFEDSQPTGHCEAPDFATALRRAYEDGADIHTSTPSGLQT